jgi:hypothetical protein
MLTFKPSITVDLRPKGVVTDLSESFIYTIVPHIVSVKEL